MWKFILGLLLTINVCYAGDIEMVVPPEAPLNRRIFFILDASGSMEGDKLKRAIEAIIELAEQDTDEMEIAVLAFNVELYRWPGVPEPNKGIPRGWANPNPETLKNLNSWISRLTGQFDTHLIPALQAAFNERRDHMSIVVVSDGWFNDPTPHVPGVDNSIILTGVYKGLIKGAQNQWEKAGRVPLTVVGYAIDGAGTIMLNEIGTTGKGGYFIERMSIPEELDRFLPFPPLPPPPPPPPGEVR